MSRPSFCHMPVLLLGALYLSGCGNHRDGPSIAEPELVPEQSPERPAPEPVKASLVVAIVLDQLSSEALASYAPHLSKEGAVWRAMGGGMYAERVRYDYAGTNTAPGHASIFTGELPRDHGVDSNDLYDYESGQKVSIVVDKQHEVFGSEGDTAGPYRLLKPTVGDLLHKEHAESKVVSLSLKARAAVAMGGQSADLAVWYDAAQGRFTTSTFYAEAMPEWLSKWNTANPVDARLTEWTTDRGELYEALIGPDDAPGEADWKKLGTTFPHALAATEAPHKTFVASPQSAEYLCDLAAAAADHYALGRDAFPDLLAISISSTDYAGHTYSWRSWEFADVLYRSDLALGRLIETLEATAQVSVIITSDHGGTPLPESLLADGLTSGRIDSLDFVTKLEARADKKLGKGNWLQSYIQPYLWLHQDAKSSPKLDKLYALISEYAKTTASVHSASPTKLARSWQDSSDEMERDIAKTIAARTDAVFIVPAEGYIASPGPEDLGTGHGTPWRWDREVPVLAFGVGVSPSRSTEVLAQNRVAPSIATLLGLGWHLPTKALPGFRDGKQEQMTVEQR